jgi:hypothetical protein
VNFWGKLHQVSSWGYYNPRYGPKHNGAWRAWRAFNHHHGTVLDADVYTDASVIGGRFGAVAVCPKYQEARTVYMGEWSEAAVYAADLRGLSPDSHPKSPNTTRGNLH